MKKQFWLIISGLFVCLWFSVLAAAQTQNSRTIQEQKAFVLEFESPYDRLTVDLDDGNGFTTNETSVFAVTPTTRFANKKGKKGKSFDKTLLRRGMQIEITGERLGDNYTANEVVVKTILEKEKVEIEGYFEGLDGDKAWIDGRSVQLTLPPGKTVSGKEGKRSLTYRSFNEMELGWEVRIKGTLQPDGIIYAAEVETKPNEFEKDEQKFIEHVKKNSSTQADPKNLVGGEAKVNDKSVKFSDKLELQTYVTKVGNRLIPRYQKDVRNDDPSQITYRFYVIEDESFNAFGLPDGAIFVHTGMLKKLKNEAQLAAVLGHEIAHVTHEHSRKQMKFHLKRDVGALGCAIAGAGIKAKDGTTVGQLCASAIINRYARDQEDQADRVGLYYMMQAGYDPGEAPKVWRELAKNSNVSEVNNFFFSGHSTPRDRFKNLNRHYAYSYYETSFSKGKIVGKEEYDNVLDILFGRAKKPVVPPVKKNTTSPTVKPPKSNSPPKPTPKKPKVRKRP